MAGDAELLDRAATALDRLLALTTPGRWRMGGPWVHGGGVHTELVTAGEDRAAVMLGVPGLTAPPTPTRTGNDLRYVVAVQPSVGRALVRWLQAEARNPVEPTPWAVAVALEILGDEGKISDGGGGK